MFSHQTLNETETMSILRTMTIRTDNLSIQICYIHMAMNKFIYSKY